MDAKKTPKKTNLHEYSGACQHLETYFDWQTHLVFFFYNPKDISNYDKKEDLEDTARVYMLPWPDNSQKKVWIWPMNSNSIFW